MAISEQAAVRAKATPRAAVRLYGVYQIGDVQARSCVTIEISSPAFVP